MKKVFTAILITFLSLPAAASEYIVSKESSTVGFSAEHAGNQFSGVFEDWSADISFDAEDLESASVRATFNLASAKTGNKMYDGTLPNADWFDVTNTPEGSFNSHTFSKNEDGSYHVKGDLTLRGKTNPVEFDFTLSDLSTNPVILHAAFPIERLAYDIGLKSDAEGEWVSKEIQLKLDITARKKP